MQRSGEGGVFQGEGPSLSQAPSSKACGTQRLGGRSEATRAPSMGALRQGARLQGTQGAGAAASPRLPPCTHRPSPQGRGGGEAQPEVAGGAGPRGGSADGSPPPPHPPQEEGELCLNSAQCKSKCCHRTSGLSLARCAPKASENSECSAKVGPRTGGGGHPERGPPGLGMGGAEGSGTSNVGETGRSTGLQALSQPRVSADQGVRGGRDLVPISWMGRERLPRPTWLGGAEELEREPGRPGAVRGQHLGKDQLPPGSGVRSKASDARRAPTARDSPGALSPQTLYGVYYKCPCERGLTCEADKSIVGSITNTNFGTCRDQGRSKE